MASLHESKQKGSQLRGQHANQNIKQQATHV